MVAEPIVRSVCGGCSACPALVILHRSRTSQPGPDVYELKCPACGNVIRIAKNEIAMYAIPASWLDRGYFYARELAEL